MKRLSILVGVVLLYLCSSGQNPAWTLPGSYLNFIGNNSFSAPALPSPSTVCNDGVTPNTPGYPYDAYDGQLPEYASNMMVNPQGEVEFFIVDGIIYDGEGNFINSMDAGNGIAAGASEITIVPDPANCDRYYIIAARVQNYKKVAYVYLLDMSLPSETVCDDCSHYGALVLLTCHSNGSQYYALPISCVESSTIPWDPSPGKISNCFIAASKLQQGSFNWVFISNSHGIFRFKIDASGFKYDNHYISFGQTSFNASLIRSEMELVSLQSGGFRLAVPYYIQSTIVSNISLWENLFVIDLDANGNAISSTQKTFPMYQVHNPNGGDKAALKGIEFSQNGDRIYVTHKTTSHQPHAMEYYDFINPIVQLQPFTLPGNIDAQYSGLELTSNDKLILANENGLYQLPNATAPTTGMVPFWSFTYAPTYEGPWVSDLMKMYMLPDQIDGMDYDGSFVSSPTCCINSSVFQADVYTASSGTWSLNTSQFGNNHPFQTGFSPNIYIKKELRIPAGQSVTINNLNLHFAPGAHLVIENGTNGLQGGKLTLNNTLLTVDDRCTADDMWLGVEVWGNTNSTQGNINNTTQGRLFMGTNSRIEHASIGILVGRRNITEIPQWNSACVPDFTIHKFGFDYGRAGGIVRTNKSSLFGNQRGVYFFPYLSSNGINNQSAFTETDFYWDGALRGNLTPQVHAQLRQVKGIRFTGCSFRNATPSAFAYIQLGMGIYSYRAQFYVNPKCSQLTLPCTSCPGEIRSTFENLRFGIRTYNPGDFTYSVRRSDFENCQYGVYSQYTKKERITENRFDVRQATYQTAGISLYQSATFTVEENNIQGIGNAAGSNSYGIVVNNSGVADNDIYLNTFNDLHIGGQSQRNNAVAITTANYPGSNPFSMSGLNWTCNIFDSGIEMADLTVVDGRIDYFQGHAIGHPSMSEAVKKSARNHFSLHGEPLADEHDIMVSGNGVQALQYVGLNTPHYFADSYSPNWVLPLLSSYNGTYATATNGMCPSKCASKFELASKRFTLQVELGDLDDQLGNSNLDPDARERLEARVRPVQEELNLVEQKMVSNALLEYETLSDLERELSDLNAMDVYDALSQTFAEDLSQGSNEPTIGQPEAFLPIEPGGTPGRKMYPQQIAAELDFDIFPNPGQGRMEIKFNGDAPEQVEAMVVDLTGRTVHSQSLSNGQFTLNLSQLSPGIYNLILRKGSSLMGSRKLEIIR